MSSSVHLWCPLTPLTHPPISQKCWYSLQKNDIICHRISKLSNYLVRRFYKTPVLYTWICSLVNLIGLCFARLPVALRDVIFWAIRPSLNRHTITNTLLLLRAAQRDLQHICFIVNSTLSCYSKRFRGYKTQYSQIIRKCIQFTSEKPEIVPKDIVSACVKRWLKRVIAY